MSGVMVPGPGGVKLTVQRGVIEGVGLRREWRRHGRAGVSTVVDTVVA